MSAKSDKDSRDAAAERAELVALVEKIQRGAGDEKTLDGFLDELERRTPHPAVSDLIFYEDLTAEEVVEKALAYRPIQLGPGGDGASS